MECEKLIKLYQNKINSQDALIVEILHNNDLLALCALSSAFLFSFISIYPVLEAWVKRLIDRF